MIYTLLDDDKRQVRRVEDKAMDEFEKILKATRNALRLGDWIQAKAQFDELLKAIKKYLDRFPRTPDVVLRTIILLRDEHAALTADRDRSGRLSKTNGQAVAKLKVDFRKNIPARIAEDLARFEQVSSLLVTSIQQSISYIPIWCI